MQTDSKWSFILIRGVLFWGYPTGLIAKSIELWPPGLHLPRFGSLTEVVIFMAIWTVGGAAFGRWMWGKRSTTDRPREDATGTS
ncbi:hypothetical protein [Salinibacter grassmerensis]|uniref:hypothetical protein n=1 Tax=Salinibacter grassmerensis TaxID=3040353 RepID=UPI0021E7272C|nr:hypothetical protein [Salinibacter grassmerensis]